MTSYAERLAKARAEYTCCGHHVKEEWEYCPYCGEPIYVYVEKTPEEKYAERRDTIMRLRSLYRNGHIERYRIERRRKYGKLARMRRQIMRYAEARLLVHAKPISSLNRFANGEGTVKFKR